MRSPPLGPVSRGCDGARSSRLIVSLLELLVHQFLKAQGCSEVCQESLERVLQAKMRQNDFRDGDKSSLRQLHFTSIRLFWGGFFLRFVLPCVYVKRGVIAWSGGIMHTPAFPEAICGVKTAEWSLLERKCQYFLSDPSISGWFKHTLDLCVYYKITGLFRLQCLHTCLPYWVPAMCLGFTGTLI